MLYAPSDGTSFLSLDESESMDDSKKGSSVFYTFSTLT